MLASAPLPDRDRFSGTYRLRAKNYAPNSENAVHQDAFARRFGFTGGLVPGVGVYALMTFPFAQALGPAWLERGWLEAKFIHPVYDGEEVEIGCVLESDPRGERIRLEVRDPRGELCAVGAGGMRAVDERPPDIRDYERGALPSPEARRRPETADLQPGVALGSIPVLSDPGIEEDRYFEELRDTLALYREGGGFLHPAFLPHLANRMVHRNIAVGPWIHTESRVVHFAAVRANGGLEMRGRIGESFEKRGHVYVTLDAAVFDVSGAAVARLEHTAIVKPFLTPKSD